MIYFDNQTTTQPSPAAVAAMERFLVQDWGAVSSPHSFGQRLHSSVADFYADIRALLGSRESDALLFAPSGPDAVHWVIRRAYLDMAREAGRNHFVCCQLDEAPTILTYEHLLGLGCEMTMAPVNNEGILTIDALAESLTPRTGLVSLSWANGLTGVVQPVAELSELCRERGIWLHIDATHVLGRLHFDLDEIAPDFITFNGDQIHAPKGTGALWMRSGLPPITPVQSALPTAQLAALATACREAHENLDSFSLQVAMLRQQLVEGVEGQVLLTPSLPHLVAVAFPGVTSDALLYSLAQRGLYASFGGGRFQQLALQLEACGIRRPLADCAVSFGLSRYTTSDEIDQGIALINETVSNLQQLSEEVWAI